MRTIADKITYEYPINEQIRICLRLENLFAQFDEHLSSSNHFHSKAALSTILHTIEVVERPDLKSKLTQLLTQQAAALAQLEQFPQVDSGRLKQVLLQLDTLIDSLHNNRARMAEHLRANEFLNQIRLQYATPGGVGYDKLPAYLLWLNRPGPARLRDLKTWANEFTELRQIVELILKLTRDSTNGQKIVAQNGFHHQNLDPNLPCQMVRITVPIEMNTYPEISVGKHRLTVRFMVPNYLETGRAAPLNGSVPFELACCRL